MNKQTKSHAKIISKEFSKIRRNFLAPKSHLAQCRPQKDLQRLSLPYSVIKARFISTAPPKRSIALKSALQRHKGAIQLSSATTKVFSAQNCSTATSRHDLTQQHHHNGLYRSSLLNSARKGTLNSIAPPPLSSAIIKAQNFISYHKISLLSCDNHKWSYSVLEIKNFIFNFADFRI